VLARRAVTPSRICGWPAISACRRAFFLGLQAYCELMARCRQIGDQLKAIRPRAA